MSTSTIAALLPLFLAGPLASAAVAAMSPWKVLRIAMSFMVPLVGLGAGLGLMVYHWSHPAIADNVGGYAAGVAIPFASDSLSSLMIAMTSVVCVVAVWFATAVGEMNARFYPALVCMLMGGVYGALSTADLFNLFVCIEVMLLPSYALLAMTGTLQRLRSGRLFVLVNLITSAVLVVGVTLTYATAGTSNLPALAGAARGHGPVVVTGGVVLLALVIKAGVFPVHTWLPRTYPTTSPAVMALFSGLHTKVAFYGIVRIYAVMFGLDDRWSWLILVMCVAGMLVGSWAGMGERTMRSVVAYQMVNGMPFMLVGLAFVGHDPQRMLAAGLFYAVHHMTVVASLVLSIGSIEETYGTGRLQRLSGLMRRDPLVAVVFVAGALSIVGLPPFSGVIAKLGVIMAVASGYSVKSWIVLAAVVIAGLGALLSMLRLWREVFWGKPMNPEFVDRRLAVPVRFILPSAVMALMSAGLLVGAGPVVSATNHAADSLVNVEEYQRAVLGDEAVGVAATGGAGLSGGSHDPARVPDHMVVHHGEGERHGGGEHDGGSGGHGSGSGETTGGRE
ncbi:monovalent cation/H+ antiporter subunit D family protein [Corynebacterium kroppenstedtii]|uniref:monovalent cation/H+ antiporter subunit D family protein n=1 Tax=Corynebacterium sp. PCR 32 TaxID=3351342 RepID=UPI00309576F7